MDRSHGQRLVMTSTRFAVANGVASSSEKRDAIIKVRGNKGVNEELGGFIC